jgi:hypothetical protein
MTDHDASEYHLAVLDRIVGYVKEARGTDNAKLVRRLEAGLACFCTANMFCLVALGVEQIKKGLKAELEETQKETMYAIQGIGTGFEDARGKALGGFGTLAGQLRKLAFDADGAGDAELAYDMHVCAFAADLCLAWEASCATTELAMASTEPGEREGHLMTGMGQADNVKLALCRFDEMWRSAA